MAVGNLLPKLISPLGYRRTAALAFGNRPRPEEDVFSGNPANNPA
jgi:hypothetical protein